MTSFIPCSEQMPALVRDSPWNGLRKVSNPVLIKNDAGLCSVAQWEFDSQDGRGNWIGDQVAHSGPEWEYDGKIVEWAPIPE